MKIGNELSRYITIKRQGGVISMVLAILSSEIATKEVSDKEGI